MNLCIKRADQWLVTHPRAKQWLWFIALWAGGILTAITLSLPIKLVILYGLK